MATINIKIENPNQVFNVLTQTSAGNTYKLTGGKSKNSPSLVLAFTNALRTAQSDGAGTSAFGLIADGTKNKNGDISFSFEGRTVIVGKKLFGFAQRLFTTTPSDGQLFEVGAVWTAYAQTNPPGPGPAPGQSFTLTTNANTATANVFNGNVKLEVGFAINTLNNGDRLTGSGVNPTLNVTINENASPISPALLSGINTANVEFATFGGATASTLNFNNATGLSTVNWNNPVSANNLTGLNAALTSLSVSNTANDQTFAFSDAALAGVANSLSLTISGVTSGVGAIALNTATAGAATSNYETVNLVSSGTAANTASIAQNSGGLTTLNVSGAAPLTLTNASANLSVFNAATATGAINYTAGAEGAASYTGGTANDSFVLGAGFTNADTVNGGAGTDSVSATVAVLNAYTAVTPVTVTNVETIDVSDAAVAATFNVSRISTGINQVNFDAGTAGADGITGNAGAFTVQIGDGGADTLGGALTVTDTGTATTDSLTIISNGANAANALAARAITSTGYETLTINTNSSTLKGAQSTGAIIVTPDLGGSARLNITGSNQLTVGVVTATTGTINASGMTPASAASLGLTMVAGANTATTITGSGGIDTLFGDNGTGRNTSITGGAGNDTITSYGGNDTILGGDGEDQIVGGAGNDSIDGGAGNDAVAMTSAQLTANDTVSGGEGTDTFAYTTYVAAGNAVAAQSRISAFEILEMGDTDAASVDVTLSNYINNTGFTEIHLGTQGTNTDGFEFINASSSLNTVSAIAAVAGTHIFDRLVDTSADSLTVRNASTGAGAASTFTAFTALDEETITLTATVGTTAGSNDLTITTLTVADLTTLNINSASDVIITNAIAGSAALRTVNATASTGAVTVNVANAGAGVTMTGNANGTAVTTFTGSTFADTITGGGGADVLLGGGGADSISGGAGADTLDGEGGADTIVGGDGVDKVVFDVGDSVLTTAVLAIATGNAAVDATLVSASSFRFANGVDIVTGFATQDTIDSDFVAGAALPGLVVGSTTTFDALTANDSVLVYGTWNASTSTFTAAAAFNATTANAALLFDADAADIAGATNTNSMVITGLTAALATTNFV